MEYCQFQSTLPVRGATVPFIGFSGGGHISIHAPREGSDCLESAAEYGNCKFQSTLPVRGATCPARLCLGRRQISIHAPREGSDAH